MARHRAPTVRLHVAGSLLRDQEVRLDAPATHYLGRVMRLGPGDCLRVFNGRDGEWEAEIKELGRQSGRLMALQCLRVQAAAPDLWLLFAPVKRSPVETLVRAATEIGVAALLPVITARGVVARLNLARLQANATEAAEQCGRLEVPACREPAPLAAVLAGWDPARRLYFCDESGAGAPIADAAKGGRLPAAVLVGPEGGFTPEERSRIAATPGALAVDLGPRTLRAETAAVAALACLQAIAGDWRQRRPQPRVVNG
ncbi:MAG: 16S rRNA (uracil(1498)-N(3))-methyltransferase [Alphaproteobacteria bacterium]|nr:16S rRNA (uracil(1498)-N(3))-methyltransferase [Alphaproteobacteria bacterium]